MREWTLTLFAAVFAIIALALLPAECDASTALPEIPMVEVAPGCFQMGDRYGDGGSDEKPVHQVCLSAFSLGKHEVTEVLWRTMTGTAPPSVSRGDEYPVTGVSWNDAQKFIALLRERTGKKWRLPTEAEWEYAARSGGRDGKYPGTEAVDMLERHAWFAANAGGQPHPVGTKTANGLGLYDMAGNVWEWVQDRYAPDWYGVSPRQNPSGDPFGVNRVIRGGSSGNSADFLRSSYRDYLGPDVRDQLTGFRLALSPE